jgi:hypothetical protein
MLTQDDTDQTDTVPGNGEHVATDQADTEHGMIKQVDTNQTDT